MYKRNLAENLPSFFARQAVRNALSLSVQRRAAKGATLSANYTLSHCISDPGGGTQLVGNNDTTAYTNPDNRRFDRGNCAGSSTDIQHIFNLSA